MTGEAALMEVVRWAEPHPKPPVVNPIPPEEWVRPFFLS